MHMKIFPLFLAGGCGKRLWPISTNSHPKQFLEFDFGMSLFEKVLSNFLDSERFHAPLIMGNKLHAQLIAKIIAKVDAKEAKVVLETQNNNTAFSVSIASMLCKNQNTRLLVLPVDSFFDNTEVFIEKVFENIKFSNDKMVLFGAAAKSDSKEYGHIQKGKEINSTGLYEVRSFVEKPQRCLDYSYLWNSGVVLAQANIILDAFAQYQPELFKDCKKTLEHSVVKDNIIEIDGVGVKNISFDKAVLEKIKDGLVQEIKGEWQDYGNFQAIHRSLRKDENGNAMIGNAKFIDCQESFIYSKNTRTVCVGQEDNFIIALKEIVLVINKKHLGNIQNILKQHNLCFQEKKEYRPWGCFEVLLESDDYKIKKIFVNPTGKLSLQSHEHRSERWIVTKGIATVTIEDEVFDAGCGESCYIPQKAKHRLENNTSSDLEIIEIQFGKILEESDIKRYEDIYKRQ